MTQPNTIADGLLTSMSPQTWNIIQKNVECVITVTEEQIVEAMRYVWERMKIVIEPSSAVPVAVALSNEFKQLTEIKSVGLVISGGNVDLAKLPFKL